VSIADGQQILRCVKPPRSHSAVSADEGSVGAGMMVAISLGQPGRGKADLRSSLLEGRASLRVTRLMGFSGAIFAFSEQNLLYF